MTWSAQKEQLDTNYDLSIKTFRQVVLFFWCELMCVPINILQHVTLVFMDDQAQGIYLTGIIRGEV